MHCCLLAHTAGQVIYTNWYLLFSHQDYDSPLITPFPLLHPPNTICRTLLIYKLRLLSFVVVIQVEKLTYTSETNKEEMNTKLYSKALMLKKAFQYCLLIFSIHIYYHFARL